MEDKCVRILPHSDSLLGTLVSLTSWAIPGIVFIQVFTEKGNKMLYWNTLLLACKIYSFKVLWNRVLFLPLLFLLSSDWGWLVDFYLFNSYKCFTINRQSCSMYLANKTRDQCQLPANSCHTSSICTAKEQLQLPWKDLYTIKKKS